MKMKIFSQASIKYALDFIKGIDPSKRYELLIEEYKPRSLDQNATFHMWCQDISNYYNSNGITEFSCSAPITPKTVKEKIKGRFLPTCEDYEWDSYKKKLVHVYRPLRTRNLSQSKMYEFMCCVQSWCLENDIPIRIPHNSEFYELRQQQGEAA